MCIRDSDYGIPSVAVDRQNATGGNGQLRTRVQAFVESPVSYTHLDVYKRQLQAMADAEEAAQKKEEK